MKFQLWRAAVQTTCVFALLVSLGGTLRGQDSEAPQGDKQMSEIGYFLGISIGQQMANQGFEPGDFDLDAVKRGLTHSLAGKDPEMSDQQIQQTAQAIESLLRTRQEKQAQEMQSAAAANLEKSELFLQENSKKEGVKQLAEGLQYKVLKEGDGDSPTAANTVRVHYTGTLINGKVFDSSVKRGEPAEFQVGGVIKGWQTALKEMKVGGKWKLFIHPQLAYGARGTPAPPGGEPAIGPNEALIFEVELLDIVD